MAISLPLKLIDSGMYPSHLYVGSLLEWPSLYLAARTTSPLTGSGGHLDHMRHLARQSPGPSLTAGARQDAAAPSRHWHGLRHTHATIALRLAIHRKSANVSASRAQQFTLKQYAHVIPGCQSDAAGEVAKLAAGGQRHSLEVTPTPKSGACRLQSPVVLAIGVGCKPTRVAVEPGSK